MRDDQPRYLNIYQVLCAEMEKGLYPPGSLLPTEKELCSRFGVSRITGKRALDMLAQEKRIVRIRGKGSIAWDASGQAVSAPIGKPQLFGLILPDFSETYGKKILYGMEEACLANNCFYVMRRSCGSLEMERKAVEDMLNLGISGIVIMPLHGEYYNNSILRLIIEGFPLVVIDRHYPGINGHFIGTDNIACANAATEYLLSLGHRKIAWVAPSLINTSTLKERVRGFSDTMTKHGLPLNRNLWFTKLESTLPQSGTWENLQDDKRRLARHLRDNPEITAVFASEYYIAMLVEAAAKEIGLRIPEDLSVLCFDSDTGFGGAHQMTHIEQQEMEIGRNAINLLLQILRDCKVENGNTAIQRIILPGKLVIGESTAARIEK